MPLAQLFNVRLTGIIRNDRDAIVFPNVSLF